MEKLGGILRKLREQKGVPLRTVAAYLDIDQAILSKMERGIRHASRKQVVMLADYFKIKESDLLVAWLSDKLVFEVANEPMALKAIQVAEEKIAYVSKNKNSKSQLLALLKSALKKDGRVAKAWIFGSFARDEGRADSDLDLMVEMNEKKKYSFFDLLDIAHILENKINRKVDLVEKGYLKAAAADSAHKDMLQVYG